MSKNVWTGIADCNGERVDVFLTRQHLNDDKLTRSFIQNEIKENGVLVNGHKQKSNYKLKANDQIEFSWQQPKQIEVFPQNIPLSIVYQDEHIAVIDKPKGMVVHPAPGNEDNTLVHALLYHLDTLAQTDNPLRPGIVHRIDKDTSGLLVVAKSQDAYAQLTKQIQTHDVERIYMALVHGRFAQEHITIDKPIGRSTHDRKKMAIQPDGRQAITHITKILEDFSDYSLIQCELETGRTHQIRVHLASINRPIVGDSVYGYSKGNLGQDTQMLHACELNLQHPITKENMIFTSKPPTSFNETIQKLQRKYSNT